MKAQIKRTKCCEFVFLVILITFFSANVEASNWDYAKHIRGTDNAEINSVESYSTSVFVAGQFTGDLSFIGTSTTLTSTTNSAFVSRYDEGSFVWANQIGGTIGTINGSTIDAEGNFYVVGAFAGTCTFESIDPADNVNLTSAGDDDGFIAKYDNDGNLVYAWQVGQVAARNRSFDAVVDQDGNVYVGGFWRGGEIVFSPTVSLVYSSSNGWGEGYLVKFLSDGQVDWVKHISGGANGAARVDGGLAIQDNVVFASISFRTLMAVNGIEYAGSGTQSYALAAFNTTDGAVEWLQTGTNSSFVTSGNSIIAENNGLYICGSFNTPATFASSDGNSITETSNGSYDGYVAKYDFNGNIQWIRNIGGTGEDKVLGVAASDNAISSTGYFNGTMYVGNEIINQDTLVSQGYKDAFMVNLSHNGKLLGSSKVGGNLDDESTTVSTDFKGNSILGGSFLSSNIEFGAITYENTTGTSDAFLAHHINIHLLPTVSEISCSQGHDGTLGLEVFGGGQEPYSYEFSLVGGDEIDAGVYSSPLSYDNLEAGVYKFTVTDDLGRTVTKFYHLIAPDPIDINGVVTDVTGCYGGENGAISLIVTGGVGEYTYFWDTPDGYGVVPTSQNQSSLTAGTYVVTVTDENGCFATETFEITQPLQINFDGTILTGNTSTDPLTPNGSIDLVVNNGTGPYTYSWKGPNGFESADEDLSGIRGGTYILSVLDDNGCFKDTSVNVADQHLFNAWIVETVNPKCKGGSDGYATVEFFNSTGGVTIEWSNGQSNVITATNLSAGEYSVTLTDDMGTPSDASDDISISLMPVLIGEPDFALSVTPTVTKTTCPADNDGSIQLTVNGWSQPYNYNWSTTNGSGLVNEQKDQYNLTVGSYTYSVTDRYGCVVESSVNLSSSYAAPSFTVDVSPDTDVCEGTEIVVTASPGFSYQFFVDEEPQGEFSTVNTFAIPNPTDGMVVKVVGMNTAGCTSQSDVITLAVTPNVGEPSFTSGASMLCVGSTEVYVATAENAETIVYSIESGTVTLNPTTGEVSNVDSDFTIRATATGVNSCGEKYVDLAVTVNPIPTPTISTSDRTDWTEGEEVSVTFTVDITEAIYQWQKDGVDIAGATNAAYTATVQGEYSVLVTKAGCTGESNKISVNVTSIPTYTITFNVKNAGQQPIANAQVSVDGFSPVETNASGVATIDAADGTYAYTVTANDYVDYQNTFTVNGEDKQIEISMLAVSAEINEVSDIKLFPNPFTNEIRISEPYKVKRLVITNIAGQKVMDILLDGADRINTHSLSSGVYLIRIISHNDESVTFRMVKDN